MRRPVVYFVGVVQNFIHLGPVSTRDNRVLKGPLGRSLRSFARTAHSAHSLRSAPLRYARFATLASLARSVHGLAHSLRSLPRGTVVIHESVFTLKLFFSGTIEILVVSRNRPIEERSVHVRSKSSIVSDTLTIIVL